jgi:hypothetical protein
MCSGTSSIRIAEVGAIVSDQQAPPKADLIEVGGLTVAYRQTGSGPTLVLLHAARPPGDTPCSATCSGVSAT